MNILNDPVSAAAAVPLTALVAVALLPGRYRRLGAGFTLAAALVTLWALFRTLHLIPSGSFIHRGRDLSAVFLGPLLAGELPSFFAVDRFACMSALLVVLVLVLILVRQLQAIEDVPENRTFLPAVLAGLTGLVLTLFANGMPSFLVGWGMLSISLVLINRLSPPEHTGAESGIRTLVVLGLGDLFLAAAAGSLLFRYLAGAGNAWSDGPAVFAGYPVAEAVFLFGTLGAVVCKAGMPPLGTWLAPLWDVPGRRNTPAVQRSSLAMLFGTAPAVYLLARLVWWVYRPYLFPDIAFSLLMTLGILGAVFGALMSFTAGDLKRFLIFQIVCQSGLAMASAGTGTTAGLAGALLHTVVTVLSVTGLAMLVDDLHSLTGNTEARHCRGLLRKRPVAAAAFVLCGASLSGIPLFGGFLSRWTVMKAVVEDGRPGVLLALVAAASLTAAATAKAGYILFAGPRTGSREGVKPAPLFSFPPLLAGILGFGAGLLFLFRPLTGLLGGETARAVFSAPALLSQPGLLALVGSMAALAGGVMLFAALNGSGKDSIAETPEVPVEAAPTVPFEGIRDEMSGNALPEDRLYAEEFGIPGLWETIAYTFRPLRNLAEVLHSASLPVYTGYVFVGLWIVFVIVVVGTM